MQTGLERKKTNSVLAADQPGDLGLEHLLRRGHPSRYHLPHCSGVRLELIITSPGSPTHGRLALRTGGVEFSSGSTPSLGASLDHDGGNR